MVGFGSFFPSSGTQGNPGILPTPAQPSFSQPAQQTVILPPQLFLKNPDSQNRPIPATGTTRWEDLHPESQKKMLEME